MIFKSFLFWGLIISLLTFGCAPYYKSIVPRKPNLEIMKVSHFEDSSVVVKAEHQSVDVGARYHPKAIISAVVHIKIKIENKTSDTIYILKDKFKIKDKHEESRIMEIDDVIDLHKVGKGKYLWWSLLMVYFTKEDCKNSRCETRLTLIPIGFFIGAIQFLRAMSYNFNVHDDFKKSQFNTYALPPKSTVDGFIYFDGLVSQPNSMDFEYKKDGKINLRNLNFLIY